jgi:hypothetical protein
MDWLSFLTQHNIPFQDRGPNVSRNNVALACPFCMDDPSFHLSLSLDGKGYRCFRNPSEHRGKAPARLVQALLQCSWPEALRLSGTSATHIPEGVGDRIAELLRSDDDDDAERRIKLPKDFKPITIGRNPVALPFINYLRQRNYDDEVIARLTRDYDIYYATAGAYHHRVIFTVYQENELVSWTGRTVSRSPIRYKTLTTNPDTARDEGLEPAIGPITDYLLWEDDLKGGEAICLGEGPFDALRVSVLGERDGIDATCCFTAEPSDQQVAKLYDVLPRYRKRYLLLDRGTLATSLRVSARLRALDIQYRQIGYKDPGELPDRAALLDCLLH